MEAGVFTGIQMEIGPTLSAALSSSSTEDENEERVSPDSLPFWVGSRLCVVEGVKAGHLDSTQNARFDPFMTPWFQTSS